MEWSRGAVVAAAREVLRAPGEQRAPRARPARGPGGLAAVRASGPAALARFEEHAEGRSAWFQLCDLCLRVPARFCACSTWSLEAALGDVSGHFPGRAERSATGLDGDAARGPLPPGRIELTPRLRIPNPAGPRV